MTPDVQEPGGRDGLGNSRELASQKGLDYAVIFNAVGNAMAFTERNSGRILDVNAAWIRATGIGREKSVGRTALELGVWAKPADRQACLAELEKAGRVVDFEARLRMKLAELPHLISGQGVEIGGKRYVLWELRDISDQKRLNEVMIQGQEKVRSLLAESEQSRRALASILEDEKRTREALRQSESRIKSISDNLTAGMIYQMIIHPDGTRQFTYLSDSVRRLYGISPEEGMADPTRIYGRIHEDDIQSLIEAENEAVKSCSAFKAEVRIHDPSGEVRWSSLASIPRRMEDGSTCWDGLEFIITERKRIEEELKRHRDHLEDLVKERTAELLAARDAAEAASRAKSIFLANMSHEIRTPMNAVLGFAQLLQRDRSLSPEVHNKVAVIMKSGEHLLSIINDILEMSRIEAGRVELRLGSVNLAALLDDLAVMFRLRAEKKSLALRLELAADLPRLVEADLGKLRQILINLLDNAVKFTQQGSIVLRGSLARPDRIAIEVQDTGIGITPEEQEKLFRPFERTHSGEQAAGGTGLGLAISREYAHMMGGEISVASCAGEGSCFRFECDAPMTALQPAAGTIRPHAGLATGQDERRILVVDDIESNRRLLRELLLPEGFAVREAGSGAAAVALFEEWRPHLIIMDLRMPGMDGYEATRRIRAQPVGRQIRIICLSASAFSENRDSALAAGADDFLTKPVREDALWAMLNRLLDLPAAPPVVERDGNAGMELTPPAGQNHGLPAELNAALRQAALELDINRIAALVEEVKVTDPVLADQLGACAARFDYENLMALLPPLAAELNA